MLSISYISSNRHINYATEVLKLLDEHKAYIKYFNRGDWEEASQRIFIHAMEHPKNMDTLLPYIKKLSREIMKKNNNELNEKITNVYNDKGEINLDYLELTEEIDISEIEGSDEIYNALKDIYLVDSRAFMKLKYLYEYDNPQEISDIRSIREKNKEILNSIRNLMTQYGIVEVSKVIQKFIGDIPSLTSPVATAIKTIEIKKKNKNVLEKLVDKAVIEYEDPKRGVQGLDHDFLTKGEPDYNKWGIKGQSKYSILKVDITEYMDYLYKQVYVDTGIATKHITWCGDSYRLDTPAGEYFINLDRDKFITKVRVELLANILHSSLHILAVTEDNIYLKVKRMAFHTMRVVFNGKVIDMPVEMYK